MAKVGWRLLLAASLACTLSGLSAGQPLRTVALTGLAADDGMGGTGAYGLFGRATINNDGHTAFLAQLVPDGRLPVAAIWSEGAGTGARIVAADGRAAPGASNGVYSNLSNTQPFINDAGQVLFRGNLEIGVGVTSNDNSAVWIANPGEAPTLVLREGDPAPGPGRTSTFGSQTGVYDRDFARFNSAGQATVHHLLTGVGFSDFGIWIEGVDQATEQLAREDTFAAGYPAGTAYYHGLFASPTINDHGTVAFYGTVTTFPGQPASDEVIWMGTPGNVERVLTTGDAAPGLDGATFVELATPSINNAGSYAVFGFTDTDVSGVWASRTGGPLELLYQGYDIQFHPYGVDAIEMFGAILINSVGEVAFTSRTLDIFGMDPPVVDQSTNSSIWSEGGGTGLREVAREGNQAVGTPPGVEYAGFQAPAINSAGQIAFSADLRGEGVTPENGQALFAEDTAGVLHLIARTGDLLDVDDGPGVDERTITAFAFWSGSGNEDGRRSAFNDSGQIVFSAAFTDGTAGVFVSNMIAAVGVPGDFNDDGQVNVADYTVWRDKLGQPASSLPNDIDGGDVGAAQYATWREHYGEPSTAHIGDRGVIPEPTTLLLAVLAACGPPSRTRRTSTRRHGRV